MPATKAPQSLPWLTYPKAIDDLKCEIEAIVTLVQMREDYFEENPEQYPFSAESRIFWDSLKEQLEFMVAAAEKSESVIAKVGARR